MKQRTIVAGNLQPFRMNDQQYIGYLEGEIERIDDAIIKAVDKMEGDISRAYLDAVSYRDCAGMWLKSLDEMKETIIKRNLDN